MAVFIKLVYTVAVLIKLFYTVTFLIKLFLLWLFLSSYFILWLYISNCLCIIGNSFIKFYSFINFFVMYTSDHCIFIGVQCTKCQSSFVFHRLGVARTSGHDYDRRRTDSTGTDETVSKTPDWQIPSLAEGVRVSLMKTLL